MDETIRNDLINLLFNFIGEIKHSFVDYRYLLGGKFRLDEEFKELGDIEMESQESGHSQTSEEYLTVEIQQFHSLGNQRETDEYLKPFSVEMFVRDADDVCQVAVMIARKLFGLEGHSEFSLQLLQIISDIREPLDAKKQDDAEERGVGFGMYT